MALDPTARRANMKDSIKKYFVDNIFTTEGIALTFDKSLSVPDVAKSKRTSRWLNIDMEDLDRSYLSDLVLKVFCATRKDPEGFVLAQLTDTVMGYLTDTTKTDGMRRIPFYRSYSNQAWELLGAFLIQEVIEGPELEAPDETKYVVMTCRLRTASKI